MDISLLFCVPEPVAQEGYLGWSKLTSWFYFRFTIDLLTAIVNTTSTIDVVRNASLI